MTGGAVVLAVAVLAAGGAAAETRQVLGQSESWTLYRVDGFEVAIGERHHALIDGACVAETGDERARLDFATFPPEVNAGVGPTSGLVIGQVVSPGWSFESRDADLVLGTSGITLRVTGSLYDDDMILFTLGGYGTSPAELEVLTQEAEGRIEIIGGTGRTLAEFPAGGLADIYRRLLDCGGLTPLPRTDLLQTQD